MSSGFVHTFCLPSYLQLASSFEIFFLMFHPLYTHLQDTNASTTSTAAACSKRCEHSAFNSADASSSANDIRENPRTANCKQYGDGG